ncbi:Helix-turn-helix domain protein [compost metagenome]
MTKPSDPSRITDILKATAALPAVRQTTALSDAMKTVNALRLPHVETANALARRLDVRQVGVGALGEPINALQGHLPLSALSRPQTVFDAGLPETPAPRPASRRRLSSTANLGELVRERRLEMSLTQQDLADAAGTGRRFISELEGGKATLEFGRILQACRILGIDLFAMTR